MKADLDRYYTPLDVATKALKLGIETLPRSCVDTTCGGGSLLRSAQTINRDIACAGIDNDRKSILSLRQEFPSWLLSVGDLLNPVSIRRTSVAEQISECDLLFINPPFSQNGRRVLVSRVWDMEVSSGVAMAYIIRSLDTFRPKQSAIIFVPESLLFSEIDQKARELLKEKYRLDVLLELNSTTFRGARANTAVIRLSPIDVHSRGYEKTQKQGKQGKTLAIQIIRGGLPIHEAQIRPNGTHFLHSKDISKVVLHKNAVKSLSRVTSCRKGKARGWVVLLPRVGMPKAEYVQPLFFASRVQLSDCVIALGAGEREEATQLAEIVIDQWTKFQEMYRGTGARYITVARLRQWLASVDVKAEVV